MQPYNQFANQPTWVMATRQEAENYFLAPGCAMIFMDPDGEHVYFKQAGYASNYSPVFKSFTIDKPVEAKAPESAVTQNVDLEMLNELTQMRTLLEKIAGRPYYNKKEGNKNNV